MTDPKKPLIDLRRNDLVFRATSFRKPHASMDEPREYLIRQRETDSGTGDGEPLIQCCNEIQLGMLLKALTLSPDEPEAHALQICGTTVGIVMSRRVHQEDYYDSGRANHGYELAWLPEEAFPKITRALEYAGEHGLAALLREGRVTKDGM